jgi:hypothetical protein
LFSIKYQSHNRLCETKKITQSCTHPAHHPKLQSFTRQKWNGLEGESQKKKPKSLETKICCRIIAPPSQEKNLHKSFWISCLLLLLLFVGVVLLLVCLSVCLCTDGSVVIVLRLFYPLVGTWRFWRGKGSWLSRVCS